MKLIIDIPDEEYETLSKTFEKERVNELSYYERVIANGIPYEPNQERIDGIPHFPKMTGKWSYCGMADFKAENSKDCSNNGAEVER